MNLLTFFSRILITLGWRRDYGDDPSTHLDLDLDLWLEVGSFSEPDKNRVYGLSNTRTEFLLIVRSVSIVGCSQLVLSTHTQEFEAILDQRVKDQMTHLATDYERLSAETMKLYRLVMEMRSQMDNTCTPSYLPHGPGEDLPPPVLLFYINCIWTHNCLNL